ncbi:type IX secretion system membrane protein PorP/SprF [Tenacibaculum sp.]|nr:type IX secretion system membrane protein PorP/SprF [Tenacibaculum sp.]
MKLKIILSILIVIISVKVYGQSEPFYSQYYNNFNLINPAYAGSHDFYTVTANVRSQWVNEPGSPKTGSLTLHGGLGDNLGVGFSAVFDKVYVLSENHIYGDLSYAIRLNEKSTLSFGIKGGGSFINADLQSLGITNDLLFSSNINEFQFNMGAGAFFHTDTFYASLSTLNLLGNKYYSREGASVNSANESTIFYVSSGYKFQTSDDIELKPSFLIRYASGEPMSMDLSLGILYKKQIELGISHRLNNSIAGLFQIRINNNTKIGYTYENHLTNVSQYLSGSHEISLTFDLGKGRYGYKYRNNRSKQEPPFYWGGKF